MPDNPMIIVGFIPSVPSSIAEFQADCTVVIVEEPDAIRKRDVSSTVEGSPPVRDAA